MFVDHTRVAPLHDAPWSDDAGGACWVALRRPYGGLWSTAADLVRFGQSFLRTGRERLLSSATVAAMTTAQTVGIEPLGAGGAYRAYYGLGFQKAGAGMRDAPSTELRTAAGFGHGGSTDSYLWIEPDLGVVFAFLSNRWVRSRLRRSRRL